MVVVGSVARTETTMTTTTIVETTARKRRMHKNRLQNDVHALQPQLALLLRLLRRQRAVAGGLEAALAIEAMHRQVGYWRRYTDDDAFKLESPPPTNFCRALT